MMDPSQFRISSSSSSGSGYHLKTLDIAIVTERADDTASKAVITDVGPNGVNNFQRVENIINSVTKAI
jgi:hypothetical protein